MFLNNKTTKESETEHWHLKSLNLYPLLRRALRITDRKKMVARWTLKNAFFQALYWNHQISRNNNSEHFFTVFVSFCMFPCIKGHPLCQFLFLSSKISLSVDTVKLIFYCKYQFLENLFNGGFSFILILDL